ncbi:MAG: DUF1624 domain-containing protein [Acidobacteria bacterium]|nr:DUF1624 domain-containing protein [Acidobacteriota bacterium]
MKETIGASSNRLRFLDLFRGMFALVMLEGHTLRAFLDPALQAGAVYRNHELIHNLPGPAFLFASGFVFSLATLNGWNVYHRWSGKMGRRLIRLLSLLFLGYALNLTFFSLRRTVAESSIEQFASLFSVNILPCIAWTALLLQLFVIVLPTKQWFFRISLCLAVLVSLATPFMWAASQELPWWLGTNFSRQWGSPFPFFPYAGFQLAGAAWGYLHWQSRRGGVEDHFLRQSRRFSGWLILGSLLAAVLPQPEIYSDFWNSGPAFFFLRMGVLAWLAVSVRLAEVHRPLPRWRAIALLGRGSLLVYAGHLVLLYGSALNPERNLTKILGNPLSLLESLSLFFLLTGLMILLCWAWNQWKEKQAWAATSFLWALAGYLVYSFVSG